MNRTATSLLAVLVTALGTAGTASAGVLEDVMKIQKNGMWEMKLPGDKGKPFLFCVTDTTKIGGLKETQEAVKELGCKTEKEWLKGDQYEIALACSNPDPNVGNFRMVMNGTARSDYISGTATTTGGGPMIKGLFPTGKEGGSENRWIRPCKAGERPGLQDR
jgi:Protein of unknown function (DUF3617)